MERVRGGSLTGSISSIKGRECIHPLHWATTSLRFHRPQRGSAIIYRCQCAATFKAKVVIERLQGAKSRVELHLAHQMAPSVSTDCNAVFL